MSKVNFGKDQWDMSEFRYVYSPRFTPIPRIKQESDCIVNGTDPVTGEFDYVSMLTEKEYTTGVTVETTCSFEAYGAPLIVFSDDLRKKENGEWYYGVHYEVVLWEEGINVWRLDLNDDAMYWDKVLGVQFPVSVKEPHPLKVKLQEKGIDIETEGRKMYVKIEDMPSKMRVGITACEGINRFYSLEITE